MSSKKFLDKWLETFGVKSFNAKFFREELGKLAHCDDRNFGLLEFLFKELPAILDERKSEYVKNLAAAYAFFCLAFWQGKSAFVAFPQNYAELIKAALLGRIDIYSPKVRAIVELLADTSKKGVCGFNTFVFEDMEALREADILVSRGAYEEFLTPSGKAKYDEFEKRIFESAEFKKDWALIKSLYPQYFTETKPKYRRKLIPERNWELSKGAAFDTEQNEFRAILELFFWKYYLWYMDGDYPLLMKPSVNITPLGTQIFIPAYMSYDAKRDLNHGKISKLHRSKGMRKQGVAFSESRIRNTELSKAAKAAEAEYRQKGVKGDKLLECIAHAIGRPDMDFRALRRLLK